MKQVLIDAIKLRKDLPKNADYYEALAWIDEAEEVDAIPISWLKRVNALCGQETRLQEAIDLWESREKENEDV